MMNKLKILVVDDESRMRKLVRDFLVKQNFEVVEAVEVLVFLSDFSRSQHDQIHRSIRHRPQDLPG